MSQNPYITLLKDKKHRISKTREAVISFFCTHEKPLTAKSILNLLVETGNKVNKTTVYRELDFLQAQGIIKQVQVHAKIEYYELADRVHHHHFVCTNCNNIRDFAPSDTVEKEIQKLITDLEAKTGFRVDEHAFELFGRCGKCRD